MILFDFFIIFGPPEATRFYKYTLAIDSIFPKPTIYSLNLQTTGECSYMSIHLYKLAALQLLQNCSDFLQLQDGFEMLKPPFSAFR